MERKMSLLSKVKVRGSQGSWLVSANIPGYGKIKLPTAHKRFLKGLHYNRADGLMVQVAPGKYSEWREALLKHKMVVLTDDEWTSDLEVKRKGYIAIYEVTGIKITPDDKEHSFDLAFRVANAA
jgi:hypothetical protein